MFFLRLSCALLLLTVACESPSRSGAGADAAASPVAASPPRHQQVITVITPHWDSLQAELTAWQWTDGQWQVRQRHAAVVGQRGLGWGVGLEDYRDRPGPVKVEGDKKSPAGLFSLGTAFGYDAPADLPDLRLPYVDMTYETMCIEDTGSAFYNQIVQEDKVAADWNSRDRMQREDDLYKFGIFVNHNADPAEAGAGSCIFLHLWGDDHGGTLGCTAMSEGDIVSLLNWLDPDQAPVLLQVPAAEMAAFAESLSLRVK